MAKNHIIYTKKDGEIHPLTNTGQVLSPDGETLEHRLSRITDAVQGKGESANANEWPLMHLGDFSKWGGPSEANSANGAINGIYVSNDKASQGHFRLTVNSQTVNIHQFAVDRNLGYWAQIAVGLVAPTSDGANLQKGSTPTILWRMRKDDSQGALVSEPWQGLATLALKTVNGQSLIGNGDIVVSESGTIAIDENIDSTSHNPVSNSTIAAALQELSSQIENIDVDGSVIILKGWTYSSSFIGEFDDGDYGYVEIAKQIYRYTNGNWVLYGTPQDSTLYIRTSTMGVFYWDGSKLCPLLGDVPLSAVDTTKTSPVNSAAVVDYVAQREAVINENMSALGNSPYRRVRMWESNPDVSTLDNWKIGDLYYNSAGSGTLKEVTKVDANGNVTESADAIWDTASLYLVQPTGKLSYVDNEGNLTPFSKLQSASITEGITIGEGGYEVTISSDDSATAIDSESLEFQFNKDVQAPGFVVEGEDNTKVVLAGGGTKAISDFSPVISPAQVISDSTQAIPSSKAVKDYVDSAITEGPVVAESSKGFGTDNYGNPLFPEYYLQVSYGSSTVNLGELYNSSDIEEKAAADAFIATIKWGINFYDWPLRCYNGTVSVSNVESTPSDIKVFAPEEHNMYSTPGMDIEYNSGDVYLNVYEDSITHNIVNAFVLGVTINGVTTYYKEWKNSGEWNDLKTGKARKDCVFSDISFDSQTSKHVRTSKVFGYITDGVWTDIHDLSSPLMTDFTEPIRRCLVSTTGKNGGDMRLSDRIYFMGFRNQDSTGSSAINELVPLYEKSGFIIDGGKGVLFPRYYINRDITPHQGILCDSAQTIFRLRGVSNCKICNITMRTLRDRDNVTDGVPISPLQTRKEISNSDSILGAFSITNSRTDDNPSINSTPNNGAFRKITQNVVISNIDLSGFNDDFSVNSGQAVGDTPVRNIIIDGWKSRNGWKNGLGCLEDVIIRNADYEQRRYAGGLNHVFYIHANVRRMYFVNCKFKTAEFSASGFDFRGVSSGSGGSVAPTDIYFSHCDLLGGFVLRGSPTGQMVPWLYFEDCIFTQTTDKVINNDRELVTSSKFVSILAQNWSFKRCLFKLKTYLGNEESGTAGSKNTLIFEDCNIVSEYSSLFPGSMANVNVYSNRVCSNVPWNTSTKTSFLDDTISEIQDDVSDNESSIGTVKTILYGSETSANYSVDTIEERPVEARVGETCYVSTINKFYTCLDSAQLSVSVLYINIRTRPISETSVTFSVELTSGEVLENITFTYYPSTSYDKSSAESLVGSIKNLGYGNARVANNPATTNGKIYIEIPSKEYAARIVSVIRDTDNILIQCNKSLGSYGKIYTPPRWDDGADLGNDGLISQVSLLEENIGEYNSESTITERLDNIEHVLPTTGNSSSRPTDAPIGYCYFDTDKGFPVWVSSRTDSGQIVSLTWVKADGTNPYPVGEESGSLGV